VQSPEDIREIRSQLPKDRSPLIMAKIEKRQALADLDAIMEAADGVIVARGDLDIEADLTETPVVQKRIIALANSKAR
jgi:pyruvate kinase